MIMNLKLIIYIYILIYLIGCTSNPNLLIYEANSFKGSNGELEVNYHDVIVFDKENNHIDYGGGVYTKIINCSDVVWDCIKAREFSFSIQNGWKGDTNEWFHNGVKFKLLKVVDGGETFHIHAITKLDAPSTAVEIVFLYSLSDGILGFLRNVRVNYKDDKLTPVWYFKK